MKIKFIFSVSERRVLSKLNSPAKIQDFLDDLDYHFEDEGRSYFSPRQVLANGKADCLEGAVFAAAALRFNDERPLVTATSSVRDHDHVFSLFKRNRYFGAISKSKYLGILYREPIHRDLRELMVSCFEEYFNFDREKTLRGYCRPVNLSRFDELDWMTTDKPISFIEDYLNEVRYYSILGKTAKKNLRRTTPLMKRAGELWMTENNVLEKAEEELRT